MAEVAEMIQAASQAHRAGDLGKAQALYREALDRDPSRPLVWSMLAQVYAQLNLFDRADEHFRKAIELEPGQFVHRFFRAQTLRRLGRLAEAADELGASARLRPDHLESHAQRCAILERLGDTEALAAARAALLTAIPGDPEGAERLGDEHARTRRPREALLCYRRARELGGKSPALLMKLAKGLADARDLEAARDVYQEVVEAEPGAPGAASALVSLSERLNRLDDARWYAGTALERDPDDVDLNLALAKLDRRDKDLPGARSRLERLVRSPRISSKWVYGTVANELAMTLDAMGQYDEAFERYRESQRVLAERQESRRYPLGEYPAWLSHVRRSLSPDLVASWGSVEGLDPSRAPIFFVGFPRSGTTLLERMLDAHPRLIATDEAGLLPDLMNKAKALIGDQTPFPQNLALLSPDHVSQLRRAYLADAASLLGPEEVAGKRVVDKLPLNIARLAAVRRIFPDAKVIVALRDPRDVVLSCFFQVFGPNHAMVHFHDLDTTVRIYAEVMSLWIKERETLGLDFIESRYEDLVRDPEGQARRVVEFLGEPWDDAVLRFRESGVQTQINTPSYQAVAEPIHTRAAGRWKNYMWHVERHLPTLEPFIQAFGYAR
ncbi:MAG: sulfotransferase [Phycisphaerales bacterium]|nr:sulfotransferase [Phycisphaerales bacterium]